MIELRENISRDIVEVCTKTYVFSESLPEVGQAINDAVGKDLLDLYDIFLEIGLPEEVEDEDSYEDSLSW